MNRWLNILIEIKVKLDEFRNLINKKMLENMLELFDIFLEVKAVV